MTYQTTVTSKGQITIPKALRDKLGLHTARRVIVQLEPKGQQSLEVRPALDFFEVIKKIKRPKNPMNVLKAREYMERNYERA